MSERRHSKTSDIGNERPVCHPKHGQIGRRANRHQAGQSLRRAEIRDQPARLSSTRNDDIVCSAQCRQRQGNAQCYAQHRHQEFIKFLRRLDSEFEPRVDLHLLMDNYGTYKHEKVRRFLERHPRFEASIEPPARYSVWLRDP
jgi:hypothetical protein